MIPVASAHGGHVSINGVYLAQWYALIPLLLGIGIVGVSAYLPRTHLVSMGYSPYALLGIFVGLVIAIIGAVGLVQLSPIESFSTAQSPIPRTLYNPLTVVLGGGIILGGVLGGQLRWPRRPRYTGLSVLLGFWIAFPGLMAVLNVYKPSLYTPTNPLGYLIVLSLPVALGYILWRDAREVFVQLRADRLARRFGVGVGLLSIIFFMFSSGMVTVVPDEGVGVSWSHGFVTTMPIQGPLVLWPAVEVWVPQIPFSGMLSVGTALLLGIFGSLIGLNAALFASQWHSRSQGQASSTSGTSQATTGAVGIAAPNACCCCGPLLSQLAVVAFGPSAAMPIYLLFTDIASPVGTIFFVASVALLTGNLVYAARSLPARADVDHCGVPT